MRLHVERAAAGAGELVDALDQLLIAAPHGGQTACSARSIARQTTGITGQNAPLPAIAQVSTSVAEIQPDTAARNANLRQRPRRTCAAPKSAALSPNGTARPYHTQIGQNDPPASPRSRSRQGDEPRHRGLQC